MKEIKTKQTLKDIKVLDKTADVSRRAKNAYIRTKEQTEQLGHNEDGNYIDNAANSVRESAETVVRKAGHIAENYGKKTVEKIKEHRAPDTDSPPSDASSGEYARWASKSETKETAQRNVAPTEIKQTTERNIYPNKAKESVRQNVSQPVGKQTAKPETKYTPAQTSTTGTTNRRFTLSKSNELAKHMFVQNRAKQRLIRKIEIQTADQKAAQTQLQPTFEHITAPAVQRPHLQPAEKTIQQTSNSLGTAARTVRQTVDSGGKTIKKASKGAVKAAQKSVKTAEHTAKAAVKTSQAATKTAVKTAQAAQRAAQAARAMARVATVSAKAAVKAMIATVKAIIAAAKSLISLIAAGGWVAIIVILVICLAGLLLGSVFGIFYSNESPGGNAPIMTEVVSQLNNEFVARIEQIENENPHDTLNLSNNGSSTIVANWRDILAVYTVKVAADPENGMDVATIDDTKLGILRDIFCDMNKIDYWIQTVEHEETVTSTDKDGNETEETVTTIETILHINVTSKSSSDMIGRYSFNAQQVEMLNELMQDKYQQLFLRLTGSYVDIALSPQEIAAITENLPSNIDEQRKNVMLAAYSLVGKVSYFWGGKSSVIGWDSRWGTLTKVTAEGSPTTRTVRPFGLDCSGYVAWVFANATGTADAADRIGYGASSQYAVCTPISWNQAQPGDLAFYADLSHVGIVVGSKNENLLIANCSSTQDNVVVSNVSRASSSGFYIIGRPHFYE